MYNNYSAIGDAICNLFIAIVILLLISIPLAVWKLIDIVIWLYKHITITLQ